MFCSYAGSTNRRVPSTVPSCAEIIELSTGLDLDSLLAAREVAEKEDFSRVLINASLDRIITYDKQARYTLWSPSMERISGVKAKDVIGRCCYDVFPFLKKTGWTTPFKDRSKVKPLAPSLYLSRSQRPVCGALLNSKIFRFSTNSARSQEVSRLFAMSPTSNGNLMLSSNATANSNRRSANSKESSQTANKRSY